MYQCQSNSFKIFPELIRGKVHYKNWALDLSRKPITQKLFKLAIENGGVTPSRYDLIEQIYHVDPVACSDRLRLSLLHNLTKLVSRSRSIAASAFAAESASHWFIYNSVLDNYSLVGEVGAKPGYSRHRAMR